MQACGQCDYYIGDKQSACPHPERRALSEVCKKFEYTNPKKRINALQAENKQQKEHIQKLEQQLGLCKNRFEASNLQAENARLRKALIIFRKAEEGTVNYLEMFEAQCEYTIDLEAENAEKDKEIARLREACKFVATNTPVSALGEGYNMLCKALKK